MSLDRLLSLLQGAGVIDASQVDRVRDGAGRRRRELRSENEKAGYSQSRTSTRCGVSRGGI